MEKKCNGCKKLLIESEFISDSRVKPYAKCNLCRLKLVKLRGNCKICGISAVFNFEGEHVGLYCLTHKEPGMVDVKSKRCKKDGCKSLSPVFNFEGEPVGLYCGTHKKLGMVDIKSKRCKNDGCKQQPGYNFEGEPGLYCVTHKEPGMVNVKSKKCKNEGCKQQPGYNFEGEPVGLYCVTHKEPGMVDVKHKRCNKEGCKSLSPVFNFEGEPIGLYCSTHKEPKMVNVKSKKCKNEGCKQQPGYNFEGEPFGLYCSTHKEPGMVDVKNKRCKKDGCNKVTPVYNFEGEPVGLYCSKHKEPGMVDVKSKRCKNEGCKQQPGYNFEGEPVGLYCVTHKEPGMVDVKSKQCTHLSCRTRATYNLPGIFPGFCTKHKTEGMVKQPRKKCEDCDEIALYGILTQTHCELHKTKDEYNLSERMCQNPDCTQKNIDILDKFGNCVSFCSMVKQSEIYIKHQKKKEEFVGNLLTYHIEHPLYMRDVKGDNGCSNSRPDFVYHMGTHVVVIEVDENQHKSYNNCGTTKDAKQDAENRRMYNLSTEFDGLPVIFIRYNPDGYRVGGVIVKTPDQKRHDTLIRWVKKCMIDVQPIGLFVKYLYFDEYNEADVSFQQITEEDFSKEDFI